MVAVARAFREKTAAPAEGREAIDDVPAGAEDEALEPVPSSA